MNTHEIDYNPANFSAAHDIRRNAEQLRSEQTVRLIQGLGRAIAAGYAKLASYGAVINSSYRTPTAMY